MTVAPHRTVPLFVGLVAVAVDVLLQFGFDGGLEHPPGSFPKKVLHKHFASYAKGISWG